MTPNVNKRVVRETLSAPIAAVLGGTSPTYLIGWKNYWTVAMEFDIQALYTVSSAAAAQDGFWRIISQLFVLGGGKQYITSQFRDLRLMGHHNKLRLKGHGSLCRPPDINPTTAPTTYPLHIPITAVFSPNPLNPDGSVNWRGLECGIQPSQDFQVNVSWAANSVIGTTGITTSTSTQLQITLIGVLPDGDEQLCPYFPQWLYSSFTPTQPGGNLSVTTGLPESGHYPRICEMFLKGAITSQADVRVDGDALNCVSHVGILDANNRPVLNFNTPILSRMVQSTNQVAMDNSAQVSQGYTLAPGASTMITAGVDAGVIEYDLRDITQHDAAPGVAKVSDAMYGVNSVGKVLTGLQVGHSVDSLTNVVIGIAWEVDMPYQGSTAPVIDTTLQVPPTALPSSTASPTPGTVTGPTAVKAAA